MKPNAAVETRWLILSGKGQQDAIIVAVNAAIGPSELRLIRVNARIPRIVDTGHALKIAGVNNKSTTP